MTPEKSSKIPEHIAIIMDGNGRWAKKKHLPRSAGHRAGVEAAKKTIRRCAEQGIKTLTLFAFSSENWQRPSGEVTDLMGLFLKALQQDIHELHKNHIQFRVIGDDTQLSDRLKKAIFEAQTLTQNNTGLILVVALNYGGRWDLVQATRRISAALTADKIKPENIDEALLAAHLSTANLPDPDLFIRTGGESRISNFLLWQMAYTELYFTDIFWPEFDEAALEQALVFFATRQRRFGGL
jgi:undecaprenyl diphosphate synthase